MDRNQIHNIAYNIMVEYNIDNNFKWQIERLVQQHWPKKVIIYRYICNIAPGSRVVYDCKNYYIVQWNKETARTLMDSVSKSMLVQRIRTLENATKEEPILEIKVWK